MAATTNARNGRTTDSTIADLSDVDLSTMGVTAQLNRDEVDTALDDESRAAILAGAAGRERRRPR